jgi:hypothetical protein
METAFFIGIISGIIIIGAALLASFNEHDPDKWKHKGY